MTARHPAVERLFIDGPAGPVEALLERPARPVPDRVAVCCHPHPLFGGTMQNKVVHALARAALDCGVPSIRFNFRGVGGSQGAYDNGIGRPPTRLPWRTGLPRHWEPVGSGRWAFRLAASLPTAWRCRAAPIGWSRSLRRCSASTSSTLAIPACPWLVVQGDNDELVNHGSVLEWTRALDPAPRVSLFQGADHFFHGRITELREVVGQWLKDDRIADSG